MVVASEIARSHRGGASSAVAGGGRLIRAALFAGLLIAGAVSSVHATDAASSIVNSSFESNSLSGWTTSTAGTQGSGAFGTTGVGVSVVTGMTSFDSTAGEAPGTYSWTVTPYGDYMVSLQAGSASDTFASGATALGLDAASQSQVTTLLGGSGPTNAAWIYQDIALQAGDSFTMAWQYISTDYEPYNDASLTSLINLDDASSLATVNNLSSQYALLGATNAGTGNYSTGSYGATGWEISTYSVATTGTYRLGFMSFNLSDTVNSPVFFVDQAPGQTFNFGVPFDPIAPNPGSSAPTTPTATPIDTPTTTTDLGTSDGAFDGGTLTADGDTTLDQDFTINGNGGTIDQDGHQVTVNGAITDETAGDGGSLTIINSGTGGDVTLGGTNTYTGTTTIDDGATLALSGDGSIADSAGVTSNGTFDISAANGDADITTLDGNGAVDLGGNDLNLTSASGTFGGTIGGTGGVNVSGGTEVLAGNNTYTGGTTVNGGTLQIGDDANLGDASGNLTLDGGTLHTTGDLGSDRDILLAGDGTLDIDAGTTMTNGGDVGGIGALIKDGAGTLELDGTLSHGGGTTVNEGTLVLSGNNTYTGGTTVNGGTLQIGDDANLGDASGNLTLDGGTLHTTGDLGSDRDILLAGDGTLDIDAGTTMTNGGDVGGIGALIKDGAGTLELDGTLSHGGGTTVNEGTLVLSGNNTYTGGTTVNGGTLQIGGDANLGDASGRLTLDGGTLHTTGSFSTARQITLAGEGQFDVDAGTTLTAADAIDGNGRLVKQGGGTLVLTGANTYNGGTTIEGGTLQGDSTSLHGDIVDNGTLDFVQAGNGSFGGTIGGSGGLVKDGQGRLTISGTASQQGGTTVNAGTLVLTGSNTYTGGTTINGGILQVRRDANLGNASSDLTLNGGTLQTSGTFGSARDITLAGGSFTTDAGTTFTSDGAVGGTGGLVKNGQGTMVVNGVASHQGGTTVNAGVLVLNGANSYTGGTTLNGGSLQIGSDASLGDVAGAITFNGGDLAVTQSMSSDRNMRIDAGNASITTLAGVTFTAHGDMSGTGGLVKRGGGTLVVSGNNTFSGGTLIDGGVIRIDSGSSLGTGVILLHGGTLQTVETLGTGQTVLVSGASGVNVDADKTAELSGTILTDGEAGCFIKSGKGTLDMSGSATLANGTCVQDGMLRANGELTSQVQVDRPGTLRGVGVVQGSINVEGTLAPGNSPGTLSVAGAVAMHDGSTLQIDIDGHGTAAGKGSYSRLLVGGPFTAAGTLAPTLRGITGNASNAFTPELGDVYTVVQASGGVQGRFDVLQQPTEGLAANTRFQVFYVGGHAVELFVTPASYATLLQGGANGNAVRTGAAVDRMVGAQDVGTDSADQHALLFALAGLRAAAIPQVMQQLAGETHAQTAAMAREASLGLAGDMTDHLAESSLDQGGRGSRAWATLSQGGYRALADTQASGFHSQQSRASAGLDAYRGDALLWGVGLAHTESRLENVPGSGNVRGNGVLLYGELSAGPALVDGTASWSKDQWSTRRADPLAPASSLSSQADGHSEAAGVTARFPLQHEGIRIEPYVQAAWQRVSREGFVEAGDVTTRLDVGRYDATGTRLLAGLKLGSTAQDPLAASATWRLGAAVGRDIGATLDPVVDATLDGESFAVRTPSMGRTLLKLDASATLRLGKQAYLYGGLESATGHDRAGYGVNAGVRVQF